MTDGLSPQGPIDDVLRDATLSTAFGLPLTVRRHGARWSAVAHDDTGSSSESAIIEP